MTPELEEVEQAAWAQQYAGLAELDPSLGALVAPVGGLRVHGVAAWGGSAWHNQVTGLGLRAPVGERGLDAALALLTRLGAQRPVVAAVEGAEPRAELPGWLTARGFTSGTGLLRLSAPADAAPVASGLQVRAVGPSEGATVATVCLKGFGQVDQRWWRAGLGRPGWTQVVAYDGDAAVATAALFVDGPEAWLGSATTVSAARRRGAHTALVAARRALAVEQGAVRVSVKVAPGSPAHRSLHAVGFEVAHRLVQWRRPA